MRASPARAALPLALTLALAGCGGSFAPRVNGDTPVATTLDAPRGSPSDFDVNVGRRVFFGAGSTAFGDAEQATLDKQAAWLKRYPSYRVVVEGYADEPGSAAANAALGRRRADAVVAYLVRHGVPADHLRAVSYGNTRPVRRCADPSCWSQNRRAVTVLDAIAS